MPQPTPSESTSLPPLHFGVNAAIAAALIAAGIAMVALNASVQKTQLGTIGTLSFLASGLVLFLSWRMLSFNSARKDFVATCIHAVTFVGLTCYVSSTIIRGILVRTLIPLGKDVTFFDEGIGQTIFRALGYDIFVLAAIAAFLAGWKLRAAR